LDVAQVDDLRGDFLRNMSRVLFSLIALLVFSSIATAQPDATEEILKQAIDRHQAGDIDVAIQAYQKYLTARPDSPLALSNLGAAYARIARYEDAIAQYRHALKLQPGNAPVELNLALAYYKTGQTELAAATLEKVHRAAPDQLQPTLLLADCWLAMGENKKVVELLTQLSDQRPDDLAIAYMLGTALVRDEQIARGQVIIDRILRNGDSAEARLLLGTTKLTAQDYPAALVDLSKAVELNPSLPDGYSFYGQALLATGDSPGAAEAFRKELASNPHDFTANMQLAILLKEDEKIDEALACLHRALQVRPADLGARYQLATIDLRGAKVEAARRALESIVKEAPGFTEAHVALATAYYRLKRKEDGDRERAIVQKLIREAQAKQQQGLNVK
jgi:tetratricopeptide (TPR) repeat protein